MLSNFHYDKKPQISKAKAFLAKRHNSLVFHPIHNEKAKLKSCFNNDKLKKPLLNRKSVKGILNKKRWSVDSNNSSKKRGSKSIPKLKKRRNSLFVDSPKKNMIIPTLNQINRNINKTFFETRIEEIRKEIDELENNEISEIINNLPGNKKEKNKFNNSSKNINKKKIQINNSKPKDSLKNNMTIISQIEMLKVLEEDRFQKKYRKLYLSKNLYDSLDDEEANDEEKIYTFYISTNSLTVYILDFLVFISSFMELYYLPIYISLHISSFIVYNDI